MNQRFSLAVVAASALSCSEVQQADRPPGPSQYCESNVRIEFPDGSWTEYDGCNEVMLDATYEFDPDDPPKIRSFKIQLTGANEPGFECWMVVTTYGVCGPGFYEVGATESTMIEMATYDCDYVPDEYEGRFNSSAGQLRIDAVNAGEERGDFTGDPLFSEFKGSLEATTPEGVDVIINFEIGAFLRGDDSEQVDCMLAD